jgi:hypothetical protein
MKNNLLFIIGIFFLFFPLSIGDASEQGLHIDGYYWEKLDRGEKNSFIMGWAKCGKAASDHLMIYIDKMNESIENVNSQIEVFKYEGILLSGGVTFGQVIDTIDKIYSDPRVKTMDITEVMPFVVGRLIQGWTESELDELIAINVKLKQCEKEKGMSAEECNLLRKEENSFKQKLKRK